VIEPEELDVEPLRPTLADLTPAEERLAAVAVPLLRRGDHLPAFVAAICFGDLGAALAACDRQLARDYRRVVTLDPLHREQLRQVAAVLAELRSREP
jgi:hypothetical protein